MEPLKPQIAAQARLAANQVQVAQPQNQVNAGEVKVEANASDQKLDASGEIKLDDSGEVKLEAGGDLPLTQSQIAEIENEFATTEPDLSHIDVEDADELAMPNEKNELEIDGLDDNPEIEVMEPGPEQEQPKQEAAQPAVEAAEGLEAPGKKRLMSASTRSRIC